MAVLVQSLDQNGGRLIYALDDAYIHLSVARNWAQHGTWGVTRHEFSSCSSSPLWTLLLSACFRLGANEAAALGLNVVFGTLLIGWAGSALAARGLSPPVILAALLSIVLAAPLPALVFSGMEHVLHARS